MNTRKLIQSAALVAFASTALLGNVGCSRGKIEEIREEAPAFLSENGFNIEGDYGYEYGGVGPTWGGKKWYFVTRKEDPRVLYKCYVIKFKGNLEIMNLRPVDPSVTVR